MPTNVDHSSLYIAAFAGELSHSLSGHLDRTGIDELASSLPSMLRVFAYKMGHESTTKEYSDISYFVDRHRQQIAEQFRLIEAGLDHCRPSSSHISVVSSQQSEEANLGAQEVSESQEAGVKGMRIDDKMAMWIELEGTAKDGNDPVPNNVSELAVIDGPDNDNKVYIELPPLLAFREAFGHTLVFAWLLSSITAESKLETPGSERTTKGILDQLLKAVKAPNRFSRHNQLQATAVFELDWDFPAFYEAQRYKCSMKDALRNAITVTGTGNHVQAATALQYMCQVWPETGRPLLDFLGDLFDGEIAMGKFNQEYQGPTLAFQASGDSFSVAEIGTQLAWLGAALRALPPETEPSSCIPILHISKTMPNAREPTKDIVCRLEYRQALYVIKGNRMVEFCGAAFIKGCSAMAAAVYWHLYFNKDGSYISYEDPRVPRASGSAIGILKRCDLGSLQNILD
ncbi:hypothetical protein B0T18DRAFT_390326 [Schizothecium vesticola]|uniref:Uncharacterized protein n=1 Tax=Schizothecium vesticola TaxID=314040 RepID=A0AA40K4M6_9PEZI|nr:hypothetical protein B0T18DRAFT_390326 [Schizothecium vesticola]